MKILLATIMLITIFQPIAFGGWFSSDTYGECLLDEGVKDAKTKAGVRAIKYACKKRHPEYEWKLNMWKLRHNAHKSYSKYSDCNFIKAIQDKTGESNQVFADDYGVNPSTCN
jgi:hypothetical protein